MSRIVSMKDLSNDQIMTLIRRALQFKQGELDVDYKGMTACNLFFENSTRTKSSFHMAEMKLGMNILPFEVSTSSVNKGETLYDTIQTLNYIGVDLFVIRHPEVEYYNALDTMNVPLLNGGDGTGQHPSQSLLDLMTIYDEFKRFEGLKVLICGDILHSRVARSNVSALTALGAEVICAAKDKWIDSSLDVPYEPIDDVIEEVDVIMLLRVQLERHDESNSVDIQGDQSYLESFGLTTERYKKMKKNAIIMHPAPFNRGVEIASEVVEMEQSRIFTQMENGVYMRMAMIDEVLKQKERESK
ncbi:aspartate carbamoyltransferase catalytic subunit [Abyssicoccus albus]|uniref:Aspartate carbamoyltransferase n=1 Tax=Abyssicoccus albus TaxID=1817405 RepID=A0A3N5CF63_9BACL|nr:aspartate carbamoyltransferase catalytic subunit [Abyssicoccus albus]RPF57805.1 aspartate carbamoyltransferase [Abyssicoccus albus]